MVRKEVQDNDIRHKLYRPYRIEMRIILETKPLLHLTTSFLGAEAMISNLMPKLGSMQVLGSEYCQLRKEALS